MDARCKAAAAVGQKAPLPCPPPPVPPRWIVVYIEEAHAADEWPIASARYAPRGEPVSINQHRHLSERLHQARKLRDDFGLDPAALPIAALPLARPAAAGDGAEGVDSEEGPGALFDRLFKPWPTRWFVVGADGRLSFKSRTRHAEFHLAPLRDHLLEHLGLQ